MKATKKIDRRAGQLLAKFPVLQDMHFNDFNHSFQLFEDASKQKVMTERNYYLKNLEEDDPDFTKEMKVLY